MLRNRFIIFMRVGGVQSGYINKLYRTSLILSVRNSILTLQGNNAKEKSDLYKVIHGNMFIRVKKKRP